MGEWGSGSLYEIKTGRRAGAWVKRYRDASGQWRTTSWKQRPTRSQVNTRLAELSNTSRRPPDGESLTAYLDRWLRDGTGHLRERTAGWYRYHVVNHIAPRLGDVPLLRLDPPRIQQWVNDGATVKSLATLRAALSEAVRWGLIAQNPARLVRPPKAERRTPAILTPEQTRKLLAAASGDALLTLAIFTGMRQGEILGLRWQDVDLSGATLSVNRSLWWMPSRAGRVPVLTEPKTSRSRRTIALAPVVVAALERHMQNSAPNSVDGLVFTKPDGTAMEPSSVYRMLRRLERTAGVPLTTFHALRHSAASMLLESGMDVTAVSALLGHSTPYTTLAIYSHPAERGREKIAERMAEMLTG